MSPVNADAKPPAFERYLANTALDAALAPQASSKTPNPVTASDEAFAAGIKLYAVNCAVCHGTADGKTSAIAGGLYEHAPQFAKHGVEDDSAALTHWKIQHGIRWTGMPAFGANLTQKQMWQITLLLQHMDGLPPRAEALWRALPANGPSPNS